MIRILPKTLVAWLFLAIQSASAQSPVPTIEKVVDLFTGQDLGGVIRGASNPRDGMLKVGANFYFLSENGGVGNAGTVSVFDPVNRTVTEVAALDNSTGVSPLGTPARIGDQLYFTTSSGGISNRGTICRFYLTNNAVSNVFNLHTNQAANGITPNGSMFPVGDELYFTTTSGGISNHGTIMKFHVVSNTVTKVHDFVQAQTGRQPFEGFTRVGDSLYFTTFTGGTNSASGFPNGAGTLGRLDLGSGMVTKLLDLPTNHTAFPGHNPVLVGSNTLYFMTTGNATRPGALNKFDLGSGQFTTLFNFTTNNNNEFGRFPYCPLTEFAGDLYFTTQQGGFITGATTNRGVLGRYNIASGQVTKLLDFSHTNNPPATGSSPYGGATWDNENGKPVMYFLTRTGGAFNSGTILKLTFPAPAEPVRLSGVVSGPNITVSWTGGYSPFRVQFTTNLLTMPWTDDLTLGGTNRSFTAPRDGNHAFVRVLSP